MSSSRDAQKTQAWLIGGGIASLAAAVHLIKRAEVPANHIHILDVHDSSGGAMHISGDSAKGYVINAGAQPYLHEDCVEELRSMLPNLQGPIKLPKRLAGENMQRSETHQGNFLAVKLMREQQTESCIHWLHVGIKHRLSLVKLIMENEETIGSKSICDIFQDSLFQTEFWLLWSTAFFLQPWHSAVEFRRLLRKFLPEMHHHCAIKTLQKTEYTLYESLLVPITKYLKDEGVDFRFGMLVTDISMYPASEPTTVSDIVTLQNGDEAHIEVEPHDIVIVTLGSMTTGQQTGSNNSPPPTSLTPQIEEPQDKNWSLWIKLAEKSSIFGDPASFISRTTESSIETFTSTFRDSDFEDRFQKLAGIYPECGATLRLVGSPWGLCVSVPHQPLFQEQPCNVTVIWGYGLRPDKKGKFIEKPMQQCTGEEVLLELLSHLKFPTEKLLTSTTTIPCLMPLGTSMLLNRKYSNRPEVVPRGMKNMACIGQYVEISDDTTLSVEYSVRGAQKATCDLMGLSQQPPKIRTNILLEVLDLLV